MAAKRMFSIDVVDTDKFLDMPVSTQALYFHFGMRADDDGFVASPRKIVKIANCTNDDLSQWSLNSLQTLTRKVPVLLDHFQSDKERSASLGTFWLKSTR